MTTTLRALAAALLVAARAADAQQLSAKEARAIAKDTYTYGFPIVGHLTPNPSMHRTRYSGLRPPTRAGDL
jgi:hypothetical protein